MKSPEMQTRKQIKQTIERVRAAQANVGPVVSDAVEDRLIGVEHALLLALQEDNYVERWLAKAEADIKSFHATLREGCGCGVCRRKDKAT